MISSDVAIHAEGLSKRYRIGRQRKGRSFREALAETLVSPFQRSSDRQDASEFWALTDVSFDIKRGEVVGIIGRNGAGKSTLLKILSRITEPTSGIAQVYGRVGSLLEVGTGFHPELTGRENIYLNGAILGMKRREIDRQFDEIVDFAEVERFIDTPVKHYSSGMYVRLAFAVAAHLEPEILIVDEVLAVGDAAFQKKCLGKMGRVAAQGRTILFVTHNMTAIRQICQRTLLLRDGVVTEDGEPAEIITSYLSEHGSSHDNVGVDLSTWPNRRGSGDAQIIKARLMDEGGNTSRNLVRLKPMSLEFTFRSSCKSNLSFSAICMTADDSTKALQLSHYDTRGFEPGVVEGTRTVRIDVPALPLQAGEYLWALSIHTDSLSPVDVVLDVLQFRVDDDLTFSARPFKSTNANGLCSLIARWGYAE